MIIFLQFIYIFRNFSKIKQEVQLLSPLNISIGLGILLAACLISDLIFYTLVEKPQYTTNEGQLSILVSSDIPVPDLQNQLIIIWRIWKQIKEVNNTPYFQIFHLFTIYLFLFGFVQGTQSNNRVRKRAAIFSGVSNAILFVLRITLELCFVRYNHENYVKN